MNKNHKLELSTVYVSDRQDDIDNGILLRSGFVCYSLTHSLTHSGRLRGLVGSALDHRSLPPERVFHL